MYNPRLQERKILLIISIHTRANKYKRLTIRNQPLNYASNANMVILHVKDAGGLKGTQPQLRHEFEFPPKVKRLLNPSFTAKHGSIQ